jgi:predicted transcriptional regulator
MATIRRSRENPQIRDFIIANVEAHPRNIASLTGEAFGLTRQSIAGYLRRLKAEGLIESTGATSARRYQLRELSHETFMIDIGANLDESAI